MEEMEMGSGSLGGSGSSDALHGHGLKFGKKVYFVDAGGGASASATPMPALPTMAPSGSSASLGSAPSPAVAPKRGKGATQGTQQQPPRCQVEGCGADLTGAKAYYCRHKVCNLHSKSPKVIVAGLEQRFCQQCSRFHQLPEFDQGKRSCRRRLAGHNERRRKPPPGSLSSHYGRLPSGLHEDGSGFGGLVLDFSHSRISSSARYEWPALSIGDGGATSHWQAGLGSETSGVVTNMAHSYMQGSASRTPFQNHEVSPSERLGVSDSGCALSLLSTRPWGTAPVTRSRVPPTIPDNYEGSPMTQSGAAESFTSSSWSFRGQNSGSSSSTAHEHPHEANLVRAAAAAPDRQFSGELELALQGSKRRMDSGSGRSYGPGDLMHHWSL